jgi:hypothetical protein
MVNEFRSDSKASALPNSAFALLVFPSLEAFIPSRIEAFSL